MAANPTKPACIYCGGEVRRVRKGEHIVPRAIGGARTIKRVCNTCNNEILSDLDRELCSRSPLSVIAAQELDSSIWQTWDVDRGDRNLLLEARPDFEQQSMTLFPQVIFEPRAAQIRGDYEEMKRFGQEDFQKVFVKYALDAFHAHEAGEDRSLIFEPILLNPDLLKQYRYPPRIFSRRPINKFKKGMTFVLRYQSDADKRFALGQLHNWNPEIKWRKMEVALGSQLPTLRCFWDPNKTLRALAKMAVNLLAEYCPNSPVDREHFADVIKAIMGEVELNSELFQQNGFVWPCDFEGMKTSGGHSFRLLHDSGRWHVYSSFFNGQICSVIRFAGPNDEEWRCIDVVAPLRSAAWRTVPCTILLPLRTHVEWQEFTRIVPSLELVNPRSQMLVQRL